MTTRRSKPGPQPDPALVVQVAVDADLLGCEAAAAMHKISADTVTRYRQKVAADANLRELADRKKAPVCASWIEATEAARAKILARVLMLAETTTELRDVAGALKIVTDANIAERVVANGLSEPGAGASGEGATPAEATGSLERFAGRTLQ